MPDRWVLIRDPQALLSTAQDLAAQQIVAWFVQRWQVDVTFEEARASGRRDATPVGRSGDPADDTGVVGIVFAHNAVRASDAPRTGAAGAAGGMVSENGSDLFGYAGLCAAAALAGQYFLAVACEGR